MEEDQNSFHQNYLKQKQECSGEKKAMALAWAKHVFIKKPFWRELM